MNEWRGLRGRSDPSRVQLSMSCWKTNRASRAASGYPVFPNKRTVQRRRYETEDDTDDDPGPGIGLLLLVHLTHRQLTLFRSRSSENCVHCLRYSVSSRRNTGRRTRLIVAALSTLGVAQRGGS